MSNHRQIFDLEKKRKVIKMHEKGLNSKQIAGKINCGKTQEDYQ